MGVLYDYFRAADVSTVTQLMASTDGGPLVQHGRGRSTDVVDTKNIDPAVALSKVIALARGVPWDTKITGGCR